MDLFGHRRRVTSQSPEKIYVILHDEDETSANENDVAQPSKYIGKLQRVKLVPSTTNNALESRKLNRTPFEETSKKSALDIIFTYIF